MEKLLVTGGAGFIGSNFVLMLRRAKWASVINLDAFTYAGNLENLAELQDDDGHLLVRGDIGDKELLGQLLSEHKPTAVINFAAESHVDRSIHGPAEFINTNVVGTFNLLETVKGYYNNIPTAEQERFRFLHVSTDEVYGSLGPKEPAFHESTPYAPNSPYAASKASSDHLVRAYHHTYGLPALVTNCSNNYGPYQYPEKFIPLMILSAMEGKPLPVYGDGLNVRDWIYVEDHCKAVWRVLVAGRTGETYNIGANTEKTNMEVVHAVCALLDELLPDSPHKPHSQLITHVSDRPGHDRRYAIDSKKINQDLGWHPEESFESGLKKTLTWYLAQKDWIENIRSGNYTKWIDQNYQDRQVDRI